MLVDALQDRSQEEEEAHVLVWRLSRLEEVDPVERVVARDRERPVAVLARAVDSRERLLMEERLEAMAHRHVAQHRHHELVVIDGDVGLLELRRHLELAGGDLVVPRDDRHAELVELMLHLGETGLHALGDPTEVVVLELLPAWRWRPDQGAAPHHEVGPHRHVRAVDHEEFLLGAHRGVDAERAGVADGVEELARRRGEDLARAEEWGELVERFTVVADEDRGDAEGLGPRGLEDEERGGRVPCGVAARFPGGAKAAGGEGGGIGLRLDQQLGGEALDRAPLPIEREEGVVLLGGEPRLRLEPVTEVRRAVRDRPLLHRGRDGGGDGGVELLPEADRLRQLLIDLRGELVAHLPRAEGVAPEVRGGRRRCGTVGGKIGNDRGAGGDRAHGVEAVGH